MRVLITGGSEGIGFETAKVLARKGNQIMLIARSKEKLEAATNQLEGNGHSNMEADLTTKDDLEKVKQLISNQNFDILINNAGACLYGRFSELPLDKQINLIHLNINAVVELSYAFLKTAKKGDALVNLASLLGITTYPGAAVYAATKSFIEKFSESLWYEYKRKGIFVLAFCPGATFTNFHDSAGIAKSSMSRKIMQMPEDVAQELAKAIEDRDSPMVVSGKMNKFLVFIDRFISVKKITSMMGDYGPVKEDEDVK